MKQQLLFFQKEGVLSNVLFSQIEMHKAFGGVVPELASRAHIEKIDLIVQEALTVSKKTLNDIDIIAVTNKPGLPGSLLIGTCFAKALAGTLNKKFIGINHLEGHAFSACIENNIPFPFLCLTASGGHTSLYYVTDFGNYTTIGTTLDDAAGEAFDKVSKLLELGYPGGPIIEKRAGLVDFKDFFNYPRSKIKTLDMSFSGLKTAVLYDLVARNAYDLKEKKLLDTSDDLKNKLASSFLVCIGDIFVNKLNQALQEYPEAKAIAFVGGVACNKYLRSVLNQFCTKQNINFFYPSPRYCTDNAAMIAFVANYKAKKLQFDDLSLDIL